MNADAISDDNITGIGEETANAMLWSEVQSPKKKKPRYIYDVGDTTRALSPSYLSF
jgi:hypothetical protein